MKVRRSAAPAGKALVASLTISICVVFVGAIAAAVLATVAGFSGTSTGAVAGLAVAAAAGLLFGFIALRIRKAVVEEEDV